MKTGDNLKIQLLYMFKKVDPIWIHWCNENRKTVIFQLPEDIVIRPSTATYEPWNSLIHLFNNIERKIM